MNIKVITKKQIEQREFWVNEISKISGNFGNDSDKVEKALSQNILDNGIETLIGHLRLCGAIPERYGHDSTEEKLYSKYTDILLSNSFDRMGYSSIVLKERADAADVECASDEYSFIADAKAFRLSRTAKNQKDFKVQAMDNWKRGKPYAIIVCPIYQLPRRTSQIYQQAITRSVCVFSYTHLSVLLRYAFSHSNTKTMQLLHDIFNTINSLNPSKDAVAYWLTINRLIINFDKPLLDIWKEEKIASEESIFLAKEEALKFLSLERERIMKLSKKEAIQEIMKSRKIDSKINAIKSVSYNGLLLTE